jgi:iron complex transport system permease protein
VQSGGPQRAVAGAARAHREGRAYRIGCGDAQSLGVNVHWLRWSIITIVSLIVASQVASTGMIGWVGLVVPHIGRMLVGPDHRSLLPVSALLGIRAILSIISRLLKRR